MKYPESTVELRQLRDQIASLRKRIRTVQMHVEPQVVEDYSFATTGGTVRLSELLGDKDDLFIIHNMGASCPYCTLWADGFNGVFDHLRSRASFVVSSPDKPEQQRSFADSRGSRFPMVSHQDTCFAADMGYKGETSWMPGVSVFKRQGANVMRVSDAPFEPGDDFCGAWHLFDLLPEGASGWSPKFHYPA